MDMLIASLSVSPIHNLASTVSGVFISMRSFSSFWTLSRKWNTKMDLMRCFPQPFPS